VGRGVVVLIDVTGSSTNLAPFSYFQMYNHDPPTFCIGYAGGFDNAKDSLTNLRESGECATTCPLARTSPLTELTGVVNMISEHFIEAANSTSINAPYGSLLLNSPVLSISNNIKVYPNGPYPASIRRPAPKSPAPASPKLSSPSNAG
jgi:hypothetical protein